MNQDIKTFELAKIYENQGYYKDAFEIYSFLDSLKPSNEIKAGLNRMEKKMEEEGPGGHPEKKLSGLFEKWLMLMVSKHRLDTFKTIKSRLL